MTNLNQFFKEFIIGVVVVGAFFASLGIDPEGTVYKSMDNVSEGIGQKTNYFSFYEGISIFILMIGTVFALMVAGWLGIVSIVLASVGGFILIHQALIGLALIFLSWICIKVGHS